MGTGVGLIEKDVGFGVVEKPLEYSPAGGACSNAVGIAPLKSIQIISQLQWVHLRLFDTCDLIRTVIVGCETSWRRPFICANIHSRKSFGNGSNIAIIWLRFCIAVPITLVVCWCLISTTNSPRSNRGSSCVARTSGCRLLRSTVFILVIFSCSRFVLDLNTRCLKLGVACGQRQGLEGPVCCLPSAPIRARYHW